jgi:maltose/glucose PTS system EIICB component
MNKRKIGDSIQQFGRTLLLPIGVLAPIGMLLGISGALTQDYMVEKVPFLGNEAVNTILVSIKTISNVVFDNIPLLFAMGVAYGMGKKDKGISVFASVAGYLTLIVAMNVWLTITGTMADPEVMTQQGQINILGIQTVNISAAGGILTGLIAAWATERFYNLELPAALAFFSGKKSVPIITIGLMATVGMLLPFRLDLFCRFIDKLVYHLFKCGRSFLYSGRRTVIHPVWSSSCLECIVPIYRSWRVLCH